ncbi:MAG: hypothetical protein ABJC63_10240 [Gemmatimonadales bacterium]
MSQSDTEKFERVILPHLDDAYMLARYLMNDPSTSNGRGVDEDFSGR